jgi:hypothetical protein
MPGRQLLHPIRAALLGALAGGVIVGGIFHVASNPAATPEARARLMSDPDELVGKAAVRAAPRATEPAQTPCPWYPDGDGVSFPPR